MKILISMLLVPIAMSPEAGRDLSSLGQEVVTVATQTVHPLHPTDLSEPTIPQPNTAGFVT